MFEHLSITPCEDITPRQLVDLMKAGHCVQRSSHAGNWSTYKLLMSQIGLPDCIWDVTCVHRDVNNQPQYRLRGGEKLPLVPSATTLHDEDKTKYLTPYHWTGENGERQTLSHFHIAPLKKMYGGIITTQSQVLLRHKEKLARVFEIVQTYRPELLGRYVLPCGCMVKMEDCHSFLTAKCNHNEARVDRKDLAATALGTLTELETLVFAPHGYTPKGGPLYTFELVVASFYLWAYWQFGDRAIYMLSGPDMLGYATKPAFIQSIQKVLELIGKHAPDLVPKRVEAKIVPVTLFRFGYPQQCEVSRAVMAAHEAVREIQGVKRKSLHCLDIQKSCDVAISGILPIIREHGKKWDLFHDPSKDAFFSQHDLEAMGGGMQICDGYLDTTFNTMKRLLATMPDNERKLFRKLIERKP